MGSARQHFGGGMSETSVPTILVVALVSACTAGAVAFLMAYEHTSRNFLTKEARRQAYGAVPGPFIFFALLGVFLSFVVPYLF
jgi:hypothetical protein